MMWLFWLGLGFAIGGFTFNGTFHEWVNTQAEWLWGKTKVEAKRVQARQTKKA